jgi:hypothetical protein
LDEKARAKAVKKGSAVDGAIAVGYTNVDRLVLHNVRADGMHHFSIVFPDRVDLVKKVRSRSARVRKHPEVQGRSRFWSASTRSDLGGDRRGVCQEEG